MYSNLPNSASMVAFGVDSSSLCMELSAAVEETSVEAGGD